MTSTSDETNFYRTAELSRLMAPADANVAGNVHGGKIMQMLEESACVAASRFFNHFPEVNGGNCHVKVLTARVESITFQQPLHVGDVAKVKAQVVFASEHTVAVAVKLMAQRISSKEDQVGNRALLWVVGHLDEDGNNNDAMERDHLGIARVKGTLDPSSFCRAKAPKLDPPKDDKEALMGYKLASMAYNQRKASKEENRAPLPDSDSEVMKEESNNTPSNETEAFSPEDSEVELAQVMLPADCVTGAGLVRGGVVMLLADNCAGVCCVRHCGTNVVTVSVDAMDLVAPVLLGDVLRVRARPLFTSSKSIEVEVKVIAERFALKDGKFQRQEIVAIKQAYFSFVSLDTSGKVLHMRPLLPKTEEDKKCFLEGKERYEQRKALRTSGAMK